MSRFEVGQKVRVKEVTRIFEDRNDTTNLYVATEMVGFIGEVFTINSVWKTGGRWRYGVEENDWIWSNALIEEATETVTESESEGEKKMEETRDIMNMDYQPYEITDEEMDYLISTSTELLEKYGYNPTESGLRAIFTEWAKQKGWMIKLFKQHPNYVPGKFYIKIPAKLERGVNKKAINDFYGWVSHQLYKKMKENRAMIGLFTYQEYERIARLYSRVHDDMTTEMTWRGMTKAEVRREYIRMCKRMEQCENIEYDYRIDDYIEMTLRHNYLKVMEAFEYIIYMKTDTIANLTEEDCKYINERLEGNSLVSEKCRAHNGIKTTKFYNKLMVEFGLDKVVDIQTNTWVDQEGLHHERQKDMGYNYYRALLGDAINPKTYEKEFFISVNPIDYWTMSLGHKWASCHTVDKENVRGCDKAYEGQWSGGTESYMLDKVSLVAYTIPDKDSLLPDELDLADELKSKLKRCIFHMGEDKLIQNIIYPDGRDGGDSSLLSQFRNIVQTAVAEMCHANNMWTLKKGISKVRDVVETFYGSTHYEDYYHNDETNVSYLHRINGDLNYNVITIGAKAICPCCGESHSYHYAIECEDCWENHDNDVVAHCNRCGDPIREFDDDAVYTDDGRVYCCSECAERDGYICTDDGWFSEDEVIYDDYWNEWARTNGDEIETREGHHYINEENAYSDDNRYCEDIEEWSNNWTYVEVSDRYYYYTDDLFEIDGQWFEDEEQANEAGYHLNDNGEWISNDDEAVA